MSNNIQSAVYLTRFQGDADKAWTECTADAFSRAKQDQGIECRTLYATPAATSVTSAQPEACTKAPAPVDQQMARWAIDGAILKGRTGEAGPPNTDHWLYEYWRIGQQLAKLGETSAWDNVTPCDTAPSEQPTGAAGQSIADDAEFQILYQEAFFAEHEWRMGEEINSSLSERAYKKLVAYIDARSPVSGQAGEADVDAINQAYANGRVAGHNEALIECAQSTAHPDLCQACNRAHKSPDCAPEDRAAVRESVSGEFPPLPEPHWAKTKSFSSDQLRAYVLADRGIRGKASDAEDAATGLSRFDRECLRIGQATQRAARDLPEGWDIEIVVEKGYGAVHLHNDNGDEQEIFDAADSDGLSFAIMRAIDAARAQQQGEPK